MKATGEVMAIDRNFTRSFQKALSSLEIDLQGLEVEELQELSTDELKASLANKAMSVFLLSLSFYVAVQRLSISMK